MLARLGEQSDVVQNAFLKYTPSLPMRSMFGVLRYLLPAIPSASQRWSSVRMKRMFGRFVAAASGRTRSANAAHCSPLREKREVRAIPALPSRATNEDMH